MKAGGHGYLSFSLHVLMIGSQRESSSSSTNQAVSMALDSQLDVVECDNKVSYCKGEGGQCAFIELW
jgi:hypothetical protein